MVDRPKTIGETIDTNGCFQTIHSMAMVTLKTIGFFTMVAITVQKFLPWEIKQTNRHIDKIYQIGFLT